ncbi:MAG: hypothetical protein WBQ95_17825 [Terracidiphilus sp.]
MVLLEKTTKKKRSRVYEYRLRLLWITVIALGTMIIVGTILLASMDNYKWMM